MKINLFNRKKNEEVLAVDTKTYALEFNFTRIERYMVRFILYGSTLIVLTALVLIFFAYGSYIYGQLEPSIHYHAYLKRGTGLHKGAPIFFSGVQIGTVKGVKFLADNRIDVELRIRRQYRDRILDGVKVEPRRQFNIIGTMRISILPSTRITEELLSPGAVIPSSEHIDIIDALSYIDFSHHIKFLEKTLTLLEEIVPTFDNEDQRKILVRALDRIGPSLVRIAHILEEIEEPLIAVIKEPGLPGTFQGVSKVFNNPSFQEVFHSTKALFDDPDIRGAFRVVLQFFNDPDLKTAAHKFIETVKPDKIVPLVEQTSQFLTLATALLDQAGPLNNTLIGTKKFFNNDQLTSMVTGITQLSNQFTGMDPEIKTTLHELSIVLKALQKTWLLKNKAKHARQELESKFKE